ncbi:MAG: hypothetical protein L6R37_005251 [Teloschistes peruensis]|nr:MAG: hypothetical protein L6R37_005251 [Teloschistes peruensis]
MKRKVANAPLWGRRPAKKAATKRPSKSALAEINFKNSTLLRLPLEVRRIIYAFVFGGQLVHIYRHPANPNPFALSHNTCLSPHIEATAYNQSVSGHGPYPEEFRGRHLSCMPWGQQTGPFRSDQEEPHSLLFVSRQIREEATEDFCRYTIFPVAESRALGLFVGKLSRAQKRQLGYLHICSEQRNDSRDMTWSGITHQSLLHPLRGLRSLESCLNAEQCVSQKAPVNRRGEDYPNFFLAPFLPVQRLPLIHVRIIVTDYMELGSLGYPDNLTIDANCPLSTMVDSPGDMVETFDFFQKRELACDLEVQLLHGADPKFDIQAEVARKLVWEREARPPSPPITKETETESMDEDGMDFSLPD